MAESKLSFHELEREGWGKETVAAAYHQLISPLTRQAINPLLEAAAVGPGRRVLDVATGAGYAAAASRDRGASVAAIDFSAAQVELARRTYPGIEFRQGEAGELAFGNDQFDAVVSNFGISHFPNPDEFLREAFRVLRRGGRI